MSAIAGYVGNAVVFGESFVQECVVRIEKIENRAVVLKEVGEESNGLFVNVTTQFSEGGKMSFTLFVQFVEVMNVQPRAAKFRGQPPHTRIAQHPARLHDDLFVADQPDICRFNHRVGRFDHRDKAHTFDHSKCFHNVF